MTNVTHQPVLLTEVLENLAIFPEGIYIDATFGRGGHSREILKRLNHHGRLFAFDKDPEAIVAAKQDSFFAKDPRFHIEQGSYTELYNRMRQENCLGQVNGILFDLGVSSPQLDSAERGFSFLREGPLDMRMNPMQELNAAHWIAQVSEKELATVLKQYGEERYAKRIAAAIIRAREQQPIMTTTQLASIIAAAHPRWEYHKHPATRSFQAIRIFINNELTELELGLEQCIDILQIKGRLLVITFHSLEDRVVKNFINKYTKGDVPPEIPIPHVQLNIKLKRINGAFRASKKELEQNHRARSASLRVMEKIA